MTRIKPSSSSTVSAFFFFFVFFVLSSFCSSVLAEAFADENGEEKTVLSVALNAQSPEWLTAVEAFLHDAKDDEEKEVSKIHTKPYGNPSTGSCLPNEMKVQIQGIAGSFCSPKCGSNMPCPADAYKGASAKGQCVLQVPSSPTPSQCALICRPEPGTNGGCPKRAECQPIQGLGICTYPTSSSSEIEDGKEEQVTLKIAA
jgi:hypothetical protein